MGARNKDQETRALIRSKISAVLRTAFELALPSIRAMRSLPLLQPPLATRDTVMPQQDIRWEPDEGLPVSAGGGNQGFLGSGLDVRIARRGSESLLTVLVALGANVLIAIAKSAAAVITRSASLTAEAAHSWADTGNELFLLAANRRSARPADPEHPLGHGREAYVWSMFAALGLFVAGGAVSITRGIAELLRPTPAENFVVGYVVLAVSFVLEGASFLQAVRQVRAGAEPLGRDFIEHVLATSDSTLRAVFAEDASALIGLAVATAGLAAHQATGSSVPDAIGSMLIGALLVVVAYILINANRRFLVGQEADPRVRAATLRALLELRDVARVTYLRVEIVGPRLVSVVGHVDLVGDDVESHVAVRLRALEAQISASPAVAGTILSLSAPDEPSLEV
jgi:cation diffusion facilitator family transporter